MKTPRIITLYFDRATFDQGYVHVNEKLYTIIPEEEIESLKYFVQSATAEGVYISVALISKKDATKGTVGFK